MYSALASGGIAGDVRLLSEAGVVRASREVVHAKDIVTGARERRSLGFMLPCPERGDPRPATAFGHPGMGGSIGFADPARRLAFGYAMNAMLAGTDPRASELYRSVYACLDARRPQLD